MERLLVNQVLFGDRDRFSYSVAYVTRDKDQLVPEFERLGVPVHCLAQEGRPWPLGLRSLLSRPGFDVVHAHSPLVAAATRVAARTVRPRPRLVYTEHNSWGPYGLPTRWANRLTYRLDDAHLAVSARGVGVGPGGVAGPTSRSWTTASTWPRCGPTASTARRPAPAWGPAPTRS